MFRKHPEIRIWIFFYVFSVSKCCLSSRVGIVISKSVFFEVYLIVTKLFVSSLKRSTMDPWLKLKFRKLLEIKIWFFLCVFSVSTCRLSPSVGIAISKLVFFVISLILTKFSISYFKCSTMDPWLQLKFRKHPEFGIWIFLCLFSVSKCLLFGKSWNPQKQMSIL